MNGRNELLQEAWTLMRELGVLNDPKLSIVAISIEEDLREIANARPPNVTRKTLAARKRLAEKADDIVGVAKHSPRYSNIEFKCIDDFEKCKRHRGKYDLLCILSYIVCIGRRIIPLVPHT